MSKDLVKKESYDVSELGELGFESEVVDVNKVVIPKLLIQQGLSKFCKSKQCSLGDIVDSLSGEILGWCPDNTRPEQRINFIPFACKDEWVVDSGVETKNGIKWNYAYTELVTPSNEKQPWQQNLNGVPHKFTRCISFYGIRPEYPEIPYLVPFRSTSIRNGKVFYTSVFIKNVVNIKGKRVVVPPLNVFSIGGELVSNSEGTWGIYNTKVERKSTLEEMKIAKEWMNTLRSNKLQADTSDFVEHESPVKKEEGNDDSIPF